MAIALQPQQLSSSMVTPGANRGRAGQRQHLEWVAASPGLVSTNGVAFSFHPVSVSRLTLAKPW